MSKTVMIRMECPECKEPLLLHGEYNTEDEREARLMQLDEFKEEIIEFAALHYRHEITYEPKFKPIGGDPDSKIAGVAQWCNAHIKAKHGDLDEKS